MTELLNKHSKAIEKDGNQGIPRKQISRKKYGEQILSTAGGREMEALRQQQKIELDAYKCSVAYAALEATRTQSTSLFVDSPTRSAGKGLNSYTKDPGVHTGSSSQPVLLKERIYIFKIGL